MSDLTNAAQEIVITDEATGAKCNPTADGNLPVTLVGVTGSTRINPATEEKQTSILAGVTGIEAQTDKLQFTAGVTALLVEPEDYTDNDTIQFATAQLANNASVSVDYTVPTGEVWHLSNCTFSREFTSNVRRVCSYLQVIWDAAGTPKTISFIRTNGPTYVVPTCYTVVGNGVKILRFTVTNGSEDPSVHNVGMGYRKA